MVRVTEKNAGFKQRVVIANADQGSGNLKGKPGKQKRSPLPKLGISTSKMMVEKANGRTPKSENQVVKASLSSTLKTGLTMISMI